MQMTENSPEGCKYSVRHPMCAPRFFEVLHMYVNFDFEPDSLKMHFSMKTKVSEGN